ncbi:MAG: long-chain-fatty-acid--CoA ligase [Nitrospinae bacterium]|nr:long-chain-fatty-acid--CoA ligase [Nitrospinota bacterium]
MMLQQILSRAAKLYPDKKGVVCEGKSYTYREAQERVFRLANALINIGIEKGDRIAVFMPNCHRYLELFHASIHIGSVIVPINTRLSKGEILNIIEDSFPKVLFIDEDFRGWIKEICPPHRETKFVICEKDGGDGDYESLLAESSPYYTQSVEMFDDDIAMIPYSSGTTGQPKGVMLTQKNLLFAAYHSNFLNNFNEKDVYLYVSPLFHVSGSVAILPITWFGATHVFIRQFDVHRTLNIIEKEKITIAIVVPAIINLLINYPDIKKFDMTSIRQLGYGGSPISPDTLRKALDMFKCEIVQGYGLTESTTAITCLSPEDHSKPDSKKISSCGKGLVGMEVRVVNENGEDVKPGEIGEIIARGPTIMKGYWNKPEETAKVLKNGWLYTGDMATVDEENYIYIVDRKKDMIISGGENIYSTEVEKILYSHPDILEAAVIGVPDEKWGEAVKAVVVCRNGKTLSEDEVIRFCKERLSGYKCPKSVDFMDSLPKSGSSKILKKVLRERY